jgi:hypothetical protein
MKGNNNGTRIEQRDGDDAQLRRLRNALKRAVEKEAAPESLRARILARIRES